MRTAMVLPSVFLTAIIVAAAFADAVATHDPLAQNVSERLESPSSKHYFGTDGFGRDVFSRIVHGTRVSLYTGLFAVTIAAVAGSFIGLSTGYCGGKIDLVFQRIMGVLLGFPFLVLALLVVVTLTSSPTSVGFAIGLALVPHVARVSRAAALTVRTETYITAARLNGAGTLRVILRHILPNSITPVVAQLAGFFGSAVAAETTLSFLGLGVPPPFPSWGRMLQEGSRQYFEVAPWVTLFPGLIVSLTILSFTLVGDALGDLLESQSR